LNDLLLDLDLERDLLGVLEYDLKFFNIEECERRNKKTIICNKYKINCFQIMNHWLKNIVCSTFIGGMVFNATFYNILAISWWPVLLE
jgi:hypothetical protein